MAPRTLYKLTDEGEPRAFRFDRVVQIRSDDLRTLLVDRGTDPRELDRVVARAPGPEPGV